MKHKYSLLMKFSLLSISLLLISASSISGAIPLIAEDHPGVPLTIIELISTTPSLACMVTVLISVPISEKIGIKTCTILGLCIGCIGGVFPAFTDNLTLILLSRLVLGIGLGLFNSCAISMIQIFFHGKEAVRMLGIRSAFEGLGGSVLTLIAGGLLLLGWHQAFFVYLAFIPALLLFAFFVPKVPKIKGEKKNKVFNPKIIPYMIVIFLIMIFYNCLNIKLPSLIVSKGLGGAPTASFIASASQFAYMVVGIFFATFYGLLKKWLMPVGIACMAIGYFLIAYIDSVAIYLIGGILAGVSFSLVSPYLFDQSAHIGDPESIPLSNSLLILAVQFGGFISPFILGLLESFNILPNVFSQCFLSCAICCILFSLGTWYFEFHLKKS